MDKHQRKYLARWESKRGREQLRFEDSVRHHSYLYSEYLVRQAVEAWEPPPSVVFAKARAILASPRFLFWNLEVDDARIERLVSGFRPLLSRRVRICVTNEEVAAEAAEEKGWKQETRVFQVAFALGRHQVRVDTIREELLIKTTRLRAIQNCKAIKEELMMAVWHPRRVGHILETYGWDAYENLLGL